jgi:transposase
MLLMVGEDRQAPRKRSFRSDGGGRKALIAFLQEQAKAAGDAEVVLAYEASGMGFGLYDELSAVGIRCHVLAPSKMKRSPKERKNKTDEKDAQLILEVLRGHYLAGNKLPEVWVPDHQTLDDREVVRARLEAKRKSTLVKRQIVTLLKRKGVVRPAKKEGKAVGHWTKEGRRWLEALYECDEPLGPGARVSLGSLLRQLKSLEDEVAKLDEAVEELSGTERYVESVKKLTPLEGVGVLAAMVFLTEMGNLERFKNRRQVAAYLGLAPSAYESGESGDRKGHITRQGSARVRFVLCQAAWNRVRTNKPEQALYERICAKNPKRKKKALVAAMRRLAIRMWHEAKKAG